MARNASLHSVDLSETYSYVPSFKTLAWLVKKYKKKINATDESAKRTKRNGQEHAHAHKGHNKSPNFSKPRTIISDEAQTGSFLKNYTSH